MTYDIGAYTNTMASLDCPLSMTQGYEDRALDIVTGLFHLRQVSATAREQWWQAQRTASETTPEWLSGVPRGERRFKDFMAVIGSAAMGAYGTSNLERPNFRVPWSLWPAEFDGVVDRVLGDEGGSAATGRRAIMPSDILNAPENAYSAAKNAAAEYIRSISPGASGMVNEASKFLDGTAAKSVITAAVIAAFWKGINAMSPALSARATAGLAQVSETRAAANLLWRGRVVSVVIGSVVATYDMAVIMDNRSIVRKYRRDKTRRDYEAANPGSIITHYD